MLRMAIGPPIRGLKLGCQSMRSAFLLALGLSDRLGETVLERRHQTLERDVGLEPLDPSASIV